MSCDLYVRATCLPETGQVSLFLHLQDVVLSISIFLLTFMATLPRCSSCDAEIHNNGNNMDLRVGTNLLNSGGVKGDQGPRLRPGSGAIVLSEGNGEVPVPIAEDDELCVAEVVATHLMELNSGRYPKLKLAFDEWKELFQLFQKRREAKEANQDSIRSEIYQLTGFFVVFQGVIFAGVAQASALKCRNWWSAVILSGLLSIVTICGVIHKLYRFYELEITIANEMSSTKVLRKRINYLKALGPLNFNFKDHAQDGRKENLPKPGMKVKVYMVGVTCVLIAFSVVFLASCVRILCES